MTTGNKTTTRGLVKQVGRKPPVSKTSGSREGASLLPHWGAHGIVLAVGWVSSSCPGLSRDHPSFRMGGT